MKKIKYITFFIISLFMVLTNVKAATISNATYDGNFKVEGTGNSKVQIVVFNPENTAIYMTTTSVTNENYSITLPQISNITPGTYTVKVADYDGTNVDTKTIIIESKTNETNPNTGDNIVLSIIIGIVSILGIMGYVIILHHKKKSE